MLVSAWFILLPITPTTVLVLAALMGRLWLAAVPLTAGLVAQSYGLRDMGTLDRIVFFGHRLGGFPGTRPGGRLYDAFGTCASMWWVGLGIAGFSALVQLPINERRGAAAAQPA